MVLPGFYPAVWSGGKIPKTSALTASLGPAMMNSIKLITGTLEAFLAIFIFSSN
jgi:hypothetical protein